jgi:hypothetical protein
MIIFAHLSGIISVILFAHFIWYTYYDNTGVVYLTTLSLFQGTEVLV